MKKPMNGGDTDQAESIQECLQDLGSVVVWTRNKQQHPRTKKQEQEARTQADPKDGMEGLRSNVNCNHQKLGWSTTRAGSLQMPTICFPDRLVFQCSLTRGKANALYRGISKNFTWRSIHCGRRSYGWKLELTTTRSWFISVMHSNHLDW